MFSIYDGREKLYQWDKDRKLIVEDETIKQVHFANCLCRDAKVCEVKDGLVDVPNELLTDYTDIRAWGYDGAATKHEQVFEVEKRVKPADYIFTQTECWTVDKAVEEALADLDLSEYVKKTDYPTNDMTKAGVVRAMGDMYGIGAFPNGALYLVGATTSIIDGKSENKHPIMSDTLDYAVKKALTDCKKTTWTDEEKAAVRALLGLDFGTAEGGSY